MNPVWIAVFLSLLSFAGGLIHHFVYAKIEIEKLKLRVTYQESFVSDLREHIAAIHTEISTMRQDITEVKTSIQFLTHKKA